MKVAQAQEESVFERKLFLGVENFEVTAVNPTMEELKAMGMNNVTEEPKYVQIVKRNFGGAGEKEYKQVSIRLFLDNKDPDNPIKTQVTFNILEGHQTSRTDKVLCLNKYGSSAWLEEKFIGAELPSNMQWYLNEDVKKAYIGEDRFIDFIKAYFNLPYVNKDTEKAKKEAGVAILSQDDLDKLFKGKFEDIRKLILVDAKGQSVGFLMGVREVEGEYKQTLYSRVPLKSYVKKTNKTDKLVEDVKDAKQNGAYADSIFDLNDTTLKEFDPEQHKVAPSGQVGAQGPDDDDDLPF